MFEEEEEDSGMTAVRYACMPSLVSLQLMRNRLHLAYLGRKLMKWSALATGRELRKIAMQLDMVYDSFGEDLRNAFMLLARGRYFCPMMNKMVIENIAEEASVRAKSTLRMVTGVKIPQYEIVESGVEPYEHLGIEKGGQQIHEAKVAWLDLLKRLILIVQLRVSFTLVELANKSATKRQNVLQKVVAPKTLATLRYIADELEEKEREDFYRLKKTMGVKQKLAFAAAKKSQTALEKPVADKLEEITIAETQETESKILQETDGDNLSTTDSESFNKTGIASTDSGSFSKTGSEATSSLYEKNSRLKSASELDKANIKKIMIENSNISKITYEDSFASTNVASFSKTVSEATFIYGGMYERNVTFSIETMKSEKVTDNLKARISRVTVRIEDTEADKVEEEIFAKENLTETAPDLDLGVWETEYEEITQVVRVKKEDGTITEVTKIIKRQKENRALLNSQDELNRNKNLNTSSATSSKSTHYSGSRMIGTVTAKKRSAFSVKRNAVSETIMCAPTIAYSATRKFLSTACLNSTNFDSILNSNCMSLFKSYDNIISQDFIGRESRISSVEYEVITNIYESASSSIFHANDGSFAN
ncbi:hypothetical protein evm_012624 [Chilo suppressalis]|nr:hypothetical protein evm_012624 [Chilo suppressalis]